MAVSRTRSHQTTLDHHGSRLTQVEADVNEIKGSMREIASGVATLNTAFAQNQGSQGKIPVGVLTTCVTIFFGAITISSSLVLFVAQASITPLRERFEANVVDVRADIEKGNQAQIEGEKRNTQRIERLEAYLWQEKDNAP
jgi:hypothetical protein